MNNNSNDALEAFFNSVVYNYSLINNPNGRVCIQNIDIEAK